MSTISKVAVIGLGNIGKTVAENFVKGKRPVIMNKITFLIAAGLLLFSGNSVFAQNSINDIVKEWERSKAYTKEYLDAMPEDKYDYNPTPQMRTFAEQMIHLASTDYAFGSAATGSKIPAEVENLDKVTDKSKANVTAIVMAGYDFVINGIKKMNENQLNEKIKLFGKFDLTREEVLVKDFEHQTHQRAQTTVYLRLVGIVPPSEKLF